MPRARLRIYNPDQDFTPPAAHMPASEVRVPLGEIFPVLADAVRSERTWLRDFADDEISISADLYEVILAYQHCRRPSA